ncbi:hypothetical protein [Rhodococcus sp. IEGM 1379]|uniref:hypothetical protein n=1 Tax=Rhodococcus sp. IEGM 1379 TaxID=3047086 RepID=UPI0024B86BE8|nr:hypothetical protein [Rhodococcus sp. IEGM 1379]MDI9913723.1 hypothetical protein [Rhodococcus sp. IEGM 1379]
MDFDSAEDLYWLEPSEFVAARNAWVMRAKEAGDKARAKELGSLRKPTTTGWALNIQVRAEPENLDRLLDLGATLRAALADPDIGDDLRRGRMLGAVSYSGFGPASLASVFEPPTLPSAPPRKLPRVQRRS